MIPAWSKTDNVWEPCWLVSASSRGSGERHVLIAFDDQPHPNWGYPQGSLRIQSIEMDKVRIRRTVVPLMGANASNLPDAAKTQTAPSGPDGTELRSS
jgi:hypothetical protein